MTDRKVSALDRKYALQDRVNVALSRLAGRYVLLISLDRMRFDDLEELAAMLEAMRP